MNLIITSSAPGRICLFGDHQDYLGFPVIAAAIDLRMTVTGTMSEPGTDRIHLHLPDIGRNLEFNSQSIQYSHDKDYLKSAVNVLKKKGLYRPHTIEAQFTGNIPIQAGTSSSAALSVAWFGFLLPGLSVSPEAAAELAYSSEVEEFDESGGKMDQYISALGGIAYMDFYDKMSVEPLPESPAITEFVLGNSLQPKDTQKTLQRVRTAQEEAFRQLSKHMDFKDNFHVTYESAEPFFKRIPNDTLSYLEAALKNHWITDQAKIELSRAEPDSLRIADLMNRHQQQLRDNLKVSTAKIDTMIDASLEAGALSAKINGSGEGGCMFAFCPGKQQEVAEAIEQAGGKSYIINVGPGLQVSIRQ